MVKGDVLAIVSLKQFHIGYRAGIDSATIGSTVDRALFPDCRQACFTVDSDNKI